MINFFDHLYNELALLSTNHQLRTLRPFLKREGVFAWDKFGTRYINFVSNDYLGLSEQTGPLAHVPGSTSGSRLLGGDTTTAHSLEALIASSLGQESALVFNSGYHMNTGVFAALLGKDDVIFADKLCHASIIDGIRLSEATLFRYHHNDVNHLKNLLCQKRSTFRYALIVSESIFSMDGDKAPLADLLDLKEAFNCLLMIDDAHAVGMEGPTGYGLCEGVSKIDIVAGTFGKALGSYGGYIACSSIIRDFLINKCRSFIFSTSLPETILLRNIQMWKMVSKLSDKRDYARSLSATLRTALSGKFTCLGNTHIVPVLTATAEQAKGLETACLEAKLWVTAVRPPAVPPNKCRLRFCITSQHTYDHIKEIARALSI